MSELKSYKMVDEDYCDNALCVVPSDVYLKSEADEVIRHQKYKRCLAISEKCFESRAYWRYRYEDLGDKGYDRTYKWHKVEFWGSWGRRWLKIAEQFKEDE